MTNNETLQSAKALASALYTRYGDPAINFIRNEVTAHNPCAFIDDRRGGIESLTEQQIKTLIPRLQIALDNGLPWMLRPDAMQLVPDQRVGKITQQKWSKENENN